MASRKTAYHFFAQSIDGSGDDSIGDEFDESDLWGSCQIQTRSSPEPVRSKAIPSSRSGRTKRHDKADRVTAPASLPLNIPDWSKILKGEYRGSYQNGCGGFFDAEDDDYYGSVGTGAVIPPHELLCRNRAASFSVHEGVGRTLKGRDLSRVRNAIFEKTGFQD